MLRILCLNGRLWLNNFKVISLITRQKGGAPVWEERTSRLHQCASRAVERPRAVCCAAAWKKRNNSSFSAAHYLIATGVWLNLTKSIVAIGFASCTFQRASVARGEKLGHAAEWLDGVSTIIKNFLVAPQRDEMRSDRRQIARGCTQPESRMTTHSR